MNLLNLAENQINSKHLRIEGNLPVSKVATILNINITAACNKSLEIVYYQYSTKSSRSYMSS